VYSGTWNRIRVLVFPNDNGGNNKGFGSINGSCSGVERCRSMDLSDHELGIDGHRGATFDAE
jgi:hypothetical protein